MTNFEKWWSEEGSAMLPTRDEDTEEFAKRIARIAWSNGGYIFAKQPEPVPGAFNPGNFDAIVAISALRNAPAKPAPHPFVVKHYIYEDRPTIKGNGFDGLEIGVDRKDAEEFIEWVNARISTQCTTRPEQEPFGYFRADAFGWTDCAETDENAKALYEYPFK
jgi:hypothetical protein